MKTAPVLWRDMDTTDDSENRIDLYRQSMMIVEEVLLEVKETVYGWPKFSSRHPPRCCIDRVKSFHPHQMIPRY